MRLAATPALLLCLANLVSTMAATPCAFVAPLRPYQDQQPLLFFRQPSRGVVALSSSSPQKEGLSTTEAGKAGPEGRPMSMTTANATAAAFDWLIDTIQNLATVIEERQELTKGTCALLRRTNYAYLWLNVSLGFDFISDPIICMSPDL